MNLQDVITTREAELRSLRAAEIEIDSLNFMVRALRKMLGREIPTVPSWAGLSAGRAQILASRYGVRFMVNGRKILPRSDRRE